MTSGYRGRRESSRPGRKRVRLTEAALERVSLGVGVEIREAIADIIKERLPDFGRRVLAQTEPTSPRVKLCHLLWRR